MLDKLRYTREEAAELLRLHVNTIDQLVKRGQLKAARTGRRVFFHREEIDRYSRGEDTPRRMRRIA
jgi:excisionase family DNA binding protein